MTDIFNKEICIIAIRSTTRMLRYGSRSMSSDSTKDIQQCAKPLHSEFLKAEINTKRCKLN